MKKLITLLLICFISVSAFSQAQAPLLQTNPAKGYVQIWANNGPHKATPNQLLSGVTTITWNGTKDTVDFSINHFQTLTLAGNDTLYSANVAAGYEVYLRIKADGSTRTLGFPSGWTFAGSAVPTTIAANKTAILYLRSYGTTDADIVAVYSVQP